MKCEYFNLEILLQNQSISDDWVKNDFYPQQATPLSSIENLFVNPRAPSSTHNTPGSNTDSKYQENQISMKCAWQCYEYRMPSR